MHRCYGRRISLAYRKPHTGRQQPGAFTAVVIYAQPARTPRGPSRTRSSQAATALVVIAAAVAGLGAQWRTSPPPTVVPSSASPIAPSPSPAEPETERGPLGLADGAIPDGTTVFADDIPGVAKLDPALLTALRQAAGDAASHGAQILVDSGWRSAAYQEHLLQEAVAKYGSAQEASRWVAAPDRSAHVSGDAVDVAGKHVTGWLSAYGAAYGLCQIYDNEPWHYELRPGAAQRGCPARYADAAHDPRLQR